MPLPFFGHDISFMIFRSRRLFATADPFKCVRRAFLDPGRICWTWFQLAQICVPQGVWQRRPPVLAFVPSTPNQINRQRAAPWRSIPISKLDLIQRYGWR